MAEVFSFQKNKSEEKCNCPSCELADMYYNLNNIDREECGCDICDGNCELD